MDVRNEALQTIYDKYLKPKKDRPGKTSSRQITPHHNSDDNAYLEIGLKKDPALQAYWNGGRPFGDESADDQGLMNKLAYWCNNNVVLMKQAFLSSPYFNYKDDNHKNKCARSDYLDKFTIPEAIRITTVTACDKDQNYKLGQSQQEFKPLRPDSKKCEVKATSDGFAPAQDVNEKSGLVCMTDIIPQDVKWLWKPYIPLGKITLMRGDPGQGKTTVSLSLAAIVSNGWAFPSENRFLTTEPGNVLYITAEDGLSDTIAPRLINAKANMSRVFSYEETALEQLSFTNPKFERLIKESKPRLVIVDPIQAYLGSTVDGHRANEVRPVMHHIGALAEKYNCAIVLIEHMNKGIGIKGLYRGLGSIDITAAARSILLVGCNPENEEDKGIAHIKSNLSKHGEVVGFSISDECGLEWNPSTELTSEILQGCGSLSEGNKIDNALEEAKDFLKEILADGKQNSNDIYLTAKQYGITKRTLQRAKDELGVDCKEREGFGKDTIVFWKLPYSVFFKKQGNVSKQEEAEIITLFGGCDSHSGSQDPTDI